MATNEFKASKSWISSSFGARSTNNIESKDKLPSRKRGRNTEVPKKRQNSIGTRKKCAKDDCTAWTKKYAPLNKEELAVHKKKISEVEGWLKDSLNKSGDCKNGCTLLLTGPPGVGKTATIEALSKDLGLEIKEWSNSSPATNHTPWLSDQGSLTNANFSSFTYENQASLFRNFLLRANKYPPLFSLHTKQIVLVEEFPTTFFKDASIFHEIIRKFSRTGRSPLIFIISDSTTGVSADYHLFPKDLQQELSIKNISFNPIAPTMLMKVLNRINTDANNFSQRSLSKGELEAISSDSMGDIRNAINSLQFLCAPRSIKVVPNNISLHKGRNLNISQSDVAHASGNRDSSLFLFHALGKILYCKRDPIEEIEKNDLPPHLSHFIKPPLQVDPEEVFRKTAISEEGFALFLHENYLAFVEDITVAAECSSWLSEAETMTMEWSERYTMNSYAASLAMRGLMFNLKPSSSGNRWRPLHKPQFYSSIKKNRDLSVSVKNAFKGTQLSLHELETEHIPYLFKIGIPLQNRAQAQLVSQVGTLPLKNKFGHQESLCKKELCNVDLKESIEDSSMVLRKNGSALITQEDSSTAEDDIVIEECDI